MEIGESVILVTSSGISQREGQFQERDRDSIFIIQNIVMKRNFIIRNEQFMIKTEYHKSQAIMDNIKICFDVYEYSDNSRLHSLSYLRMST